MSPFGEKPNTTIYYTAMEFADEWGGIWMEYVSVVFFSVLQIKAIHHPLEGCVLVVQREVESNWTFFYCFFYFIFGVKISGAGNKF